jgi:hypothetical protein
VIDPSGESLRGALRGGDVDVIRCWAQGIGDGGVGAGEQIGAGGHVGNDIRVSCQGSRFAVTAECEGYLACVKKERRNLEIEDSGQPMTREQALAMRGAHAIGEVPADSGPRR